MKKNGFTLIELLAVLLLLSILFTFLYSSIKSTMNYSNDNIYKVQIDDILKLAYDYTLRHLDLLPSGDDTLMVTLADLKHDGLVDNNIINPQTNEPFSDDVIIRVNLSSNDSLPEDFSRKEGNYIYTFDLNDKANKPVINLQEVSLLPQLNAEFSLPEIISIIVNDTDMKNSFNQIVTITKDDKIVERVDTSVFGIYNISYTVKSNDYGCANKTIKVSIVDDVAPILSASFDTTTTISLNDVSSFNLYDNITCQDNDRCEIVISGFLKEKVGTYTIKYTAKDPMGNISSPITRIIKVV